MAWTDRCRYDLLCFEGIALMLNIFAEKAALPNYRVVAPADGEIHQITVTEEVNEAASLSGVR